MYLRLFASDKPAYTFTEVKITFICARWSTLKLLMWWLSQSQTSLFLVFRAVRTRKKVSFFPSALYFAPLPTFPYPKVFQRLIWSVASWVLGCLGAWDFLFVSWWTVTYSLASYAFLKNIPYFTLLFLFAVSFDVVYLWCPFVPL